MLEEGKKLKPVPTSGACLSEISHSSDKTSGHLAGQTDTETMVDH